MNLPTKLRTLIANQGFQRYLKNTSWLFAEKILRMVVGLFVGIWVARYLGPKQFGLLSYAQSFVFLFTAIATLGLDDIVVRELVKDESRRDVLLGTAFSLKFIGAILILPILGIAIQFTNNDQYTNLLVFIIASSTIFQSFNVIDFYYQSQVLSKYVALANAFSLAISSVVKIALIVNQASLTAFAIMIVVDSAVLLIGLVYNYKKNSQLKLFNWKFEWSTAKSLLKDSWALILSSLVVSVYMKIDQVMIKEMLDIQSVGQYVAAVRLSEAWYFIPIAIANSLFPAILNAKKVSKELYYTRLQRLYTLVVWFSIVLALPISVFSDELVLLLYGNLYQQAGEVLIIHVWAGIFVALGVTSGKWYLSENFQLLAFMRTFYGMLSNLALNFILIPLYGINGAAIATVFSYFIVGLIFDLIYKKTRKTFFMKLKTLTFKR